MPERIVGKPDAAREQRWAREFTPRAHRMAPVCSRRYRLFSSACRDCLPGRMGSSSKSVSILV